MGVAIFLNTKRTKFFHRVHKVYAPEVHKALCSLTVKFLVYLVYTLVLFVFKKHKAAGKAIYTKTGGARNANRLPV